ncbi:MAG: response regulator transcription factor [Bacteroidetes bacterium]|nr:response regulator transcription factor [Bacteroidota bacterium]MBS1974094.1 response regulator transcription factor [Bacteroidota bacterium]
MSIQNIKAILIDDELTSLKNLKQKIDEFCKQIVVIGAFDKPEEAIPAIRDLMPDVLFLDIEMPKMNGFRMLEQLGDYNAEIIFTTAYNHYAIDALRVSAFDYLVKPVAIEDLENTVKRLLAKKEMHTRERMHVLKQSINQEKSQENKIAVPLTDGLEFIVIKDIVRIESSAGYSRIFLMKGQPILVTKLLKDFEDMLTPYHFFRVHNSHLINLKYIKKYLRGIGGQVLLENGDIIDVSRRKKDEFINLIHM